MTELTAAASTRHTVEGCTAAVGLSCSYDATQAGDIVAVGDFRVTIVRAGRTLDFEHLTFDEKDYAGIAHVLHNVIRPGDHVTVESFFCLCCPVPQFASAGNVQRNAG